MDHRFSRATRRELIGSAAAGLAVVALRAEAVTAQATPAAVSADRTAGAPDWSFVLHGYQDDYAGEIQAPQERPAGMRFAAAEVEIINDSDQPLAFTPIDIRLRSADGVEYRGGSAIGMEPTANPRNLNPGERSRGWVWFTVPDAVSASEIVYFAPQPQFRIALTG
ncbi:MAG TPA: DUF4352 domain-containing protein [Thermomicrobiales bacterium]|jgi:hypothetical protein|nr:DUF4352 domain-containing protein [Thermomicrobiales bacterium]